MGSIVSSIVRLLFPLLAGIGAGEIMDKVAADKVPSYSNPFKENGSFHIPRILWIAGLLVAGHFIIKKLFRGRKLF